VNEAAQPETGESPVREFLAGRDAPCPGCGYNLRGVAASECPECGQLLDIDDLKWGRSAPDAEAQCLVLSAFALTLASLWIVGCIIAVILGRFPRILLWPTPVAAATFFCLAHWIHSRRERPWALAASAVHHGVAMGVLSLLMLFTLVMMMLAR
jgi:hypothetical protein